MTGSARRVDVGPASIAGLGARNWDVLPEDRIGPPLKSPRARVVRRLALLCALAAAGWAWGQGHIQLPEGALEKLTALVSTSSRKIQPGPPGEAASPSARQGADAEQSAQRQSADWPRGADTAASLSAPAQTIALPKPVELNVSAAAAGAPGPQKTDEELSAPREPTDPIQKRAAAAGLSPDLSRALLARLTASDFDNAATAIRTAIAETPDDGVLVWPRQRKPEQALFRVHFVQGAASADCRRYVVTVVTKDGWSTTAPPMERCGADKGRMTGPSR